MMRRCAIAGERRCPLLGRRGYTLLELLIASVLIATLMAAAWNLMSMYSSFLVAGRNQAAEQQLARSLMDLLATDLRALVPGRTLPTTPMTDSPARAGASAGLSESTPSDGTGRPPFDQELGVFTVSAPTAMNSLAESAARLPEVPFSGDEHSLTLLSARSEPSFQALKTGNDGDFAFPPEGEIDAGDGDLAGRSDEDSLPKHAAAKGWTQVIYRFVPPRAVREDDHQLPPGLHRFEIPVEYLGLLSPAAALLDDGDLGFGSLAGDALGEFSPDATERLEQFREQGGTGVTHEHVPEVVACRFEFFTDAGWRSEWEATHGRNRPVAVRVRFKLLSSSEHQELTALLGSEVDDEVTADDVALDESSAAYGEASDPFAAFQPRLYERMILLELGREVRRPQGSAAPAEEPPSSSSRLLVGGGR